MSNVIRFANHAQEILFECELKGQISDGCWENSRPHEHWKIMCNAKILHANNAEESQAVIGKNFTPMRKYNFCNKLLLDVCKNRMIGAVKFYTIFPDISYDSHWDYEFSQSAQEITTTVLDNFGKDDYFGKKSSRIMKAVKAKNFNDLVELMKKVDDVEYDISMMKKDLKYMSNLVNSR